MGKISTYFEYYINEIVKYSNHFIAESGILLYIVILLAAILMILMIRQKIKIKKIHADLKQSFEI